MTQAHTPEQEAPKLSPQQSAMARLNALLETSQKVHARISDLLDTVLNDAVFYSSKAQPGANTPIILEDSSIADITEIKMEMSDMVDYYAAQKEQFQASIDAVAARIAANKAAAEEAAAPTPVPPSIPEASPTITVEALRERAMKMALERAKVAVSEVADNEPPAEQVVAAKELPDIIPIEDNPLHRASVAKPTLPENSIERLIGQNSPLLDIFSAGPWLENGRGTVTVGSPGFKWYFETNPLNEAGTARATLPSGFYGGGSIPKSVFLRMSKFIIHWSFEMDVESMDIYVVGISDLHKPESRWFKPSELSATFTRQLIIELVEATEKYKPVAN
jgi:hypothetical protein